MIAVGIPLRNEAWEKSSKKKGNGLNLGRNHLLYPQLIVWVILSCIESLQFDVLSLSINNVLCPQINFIFWCWLFTGVGGWPLDPLMQGLANNDQPIARFCIACQLKILLIVLNGCGGVVKTRIIFCVMWKLYEAQILVSIKMFNWSTATVIHYILAENKPAEGCYNCDVRMDC